MIVIMRKTISTLVACSALLAGAAPAQAVIKDPVQALKAVLATGHGVHFTETAAVSDGANKRMKHRRNGFFEFNAEGGVKALDVTTTEGEYGRERVIGFNHNEGGTSYRSGGLVGKRLQKGKTWLKHSHQGYLWHTRLLGDDEQLINPTEPATLTALLKNGRISGNTVTGAITFKELWKVSRWMEHSDRSGGEADTLISYTLTLNSPGLVSRVESTFAFANGPDELVGTVIHVDTHYSRWGSKVSIKAPDRRKTTTDLCRENFCN
ncbi:hypothetical protein ACFPOI_51265 [Nonomuraea angiospora]|uniref:Lipoprotein n=1 Tax=Nonomuraea angiospora TaxID=46172 RepID=A0ABR9M2M5_9ACTN|nr:hypothetical protein [Nonomuraea angiospora]MBE1586738.1 hypothetical protein [Nonomuraea angiospora]